VEARNCENNFENVGFVVLFFSSGLTIPAEIIVLKASSTEIFKSLTEDSGTSVYHPVVGVGAVGMKKQSNNYCNSGCREGPTSPVTKPTLYSPSRGYSTKTTRLNLFDLLLKKVSSNCLRVL
jgi:hypothetical protein